MMGRASLALAAVALLGACSDGAADDACKDVRCVTPPPSGCDGDFKVVYHAAGACSVDGAGATHCEYALAQRSNCAALDGQVCRDGACVVPEVVPCTGVTCFTPPAPDCDGNTARIYAGAGTCDPELPPNGACVYAVDATLECGPSHKVCRQGACVDPSETPCDPNPCDVPPLGTCSGNVPQVPEALGTCTPDHGEAVCAYATTAGEACGGDTAECRFGRCASGVFTPTEAGDLVFSEVMKNPTLAGDQSEWFELFNASNGALELDGCRFTDDGGDSFLVPEHDVFIPAGGYLVFGKSDVASENGGFVPDVIYDAGLTLANAADELVITCGGVIIDRVAWAADWPSGKGRSMSLDPATPSGSDNDLLGNWCDAPDVYGDQTNRGSPRRPNPPCP